MKGYSLLLISAVCLGITNFLFPRASKTLGATNATFYYYLCAVTVALLFWLPTREHKEIELIDWQWPLYLALAMFVSNWAYSSGVQYFDTAFPAIIRALSFFVTALLVMYVSPTALSFKDWVALVLVALGIILFGYDRATLK